MSIETTGTEGRRNRWKGVALLACALSVGCLGEQTVVNVEPESLWEATLLPTTEGSPGLPRVSGQAAVAVLSSSSRIGIVVEGGEGNLYWGIHRETCDEPGSLLLNASAYPVIPDGTTEIEVGLPLTLDTSAAYHLRIAVDPSMETLVACGNFEVREF